MTDFADRTTVGTGVGSADGAVVRPDDSAVARRVGMLRRCELCAGLGQDDLSVVAAAMSERRVRAGEVICAHHETGRCFYVIGEGRVRVSLERSKGSYELEDELAAGDHFGEMSVLTETPRAISAAAVTDGVLLELEAKAFQRVMQGIPGFAANLSRALGFRVRWQRRRRPRRWPRVVGLVRSTLKTQEVLRPLGEALAARGEQLELIVDRKAATLDGEAAVWTVDENHVEDVVGLIHERRRRCDRVLVETRQARETGGLRATLAPCEEIWWLVDAECYESSIARLRQLVEEAPALGSRIHLVWVLGSEMRFAPQLETSIPLAEPDFKVVIAPGEGTANRAMRHSVERLVHQLRRSRIGLALSGGGARGMAHLGVLRELEAAGIYFDLVSGTSIGALMGLAYAGGWEPGEALERFEATLTPPRLVKWIPGGTLAYLAVMYRSGAWNRQLRPYLGDARLEQLATPLSTMTVDLIRGLETARTRGDAIDAVLESINLPIISRPVLRDGEMLVDGGVLNNLPAEVLPGQGAHFVVGVDVVAKLAPSFAGNTPETPRAAMRMPSHAALLVRINEIQDRGLARLRQRPLDFVIAPDTSAFEFADFTAARGLADAGSMAAEAAIADLKAKLAALEAAA